MERKVREDIASYDPAIHLSFSGDLPSGEALEVTLHRDGWRWEHAFAITLDLLRDDYAYSSCIHRGVRYFYVCNDRILHAACKQFPRFVGA